METLGHSQVSLTLNTYSHVLPAVQLAEAAKMDAVLASDHRKGVSQGVNPRSPAAKALKAPEIVGNFGEPDVRQLAPDSRMAETQTLRTG